MKRFFMMLALSALLAACSGGSSNKEIANPNPPTNHAPTISDQNLSVNVDVDLAITLGSLTDVDGDTVTYTISGTSNTRAGAAANQVIYKRSTTGSESFSVNASDGKGGSASATITVTVSAAGSNNPPVVENQNLSVNVNTDLPITLGPLTDVDGDTVTYTISGTSNTRAGAAANQVIYKRSSAGNESFTVNASDGRGGSDSATISVTVAATNSPPALSNFSVEAIVAQDTPITLGPSTDGDGDNVTYTVTGSTFFRAGAANNQIIYNNPSAGSDALQVSASDGINAAVTATITVTISSGYTSLYNKSRDLLVPVYGSVPAKGESRTDPNTGVTITRVTNVAEMSGANNAYIVYSRYSPENSDGKYVLAFGDDSNSCWVIERSTGNVVTAITKNGSTKIGENQEVRWDYSGNHPNRVYYVDGTSLYKIDDVTNQNATRSLVKNFATLISGITKVYNDVEGDSSNDSDHWAFMATNSANGVVAFVHYQISTDTTHTLKPADLAGSNLDGLKGASTFIRPNMVEMSPSGQGVILHYGWSYTGTPGYESTWFGGPHLWPNDFKWAVTEPVKVCNEYNHSGWAFGSDGRDMFVCQNSDDNLTATYINGTDAGLGNTVQFMYYADPGWGSNFHFGKMPLSRKGWAFVNTYASKNVEWGQNQLFMVQTKPKGQNPIVWRVGPNYNKYDGDYRDEAPAAINLFGNRIYVGSNWGGALGHTELFVFHLPNDWTEAPELQ